MIENNMFQINYWKGTVLNFKEKKLKLKTLLKNYPEKKHGIQTFSTNRQVDRSGFAEAFTNLFKDELGLLSQNIKKDLYIEDIWSVSYKSGEFHTPHNHGTTGLTGILYLDMPKDSPSTSYIKPWNDEYSDRTVYYNMPVKEGDLIITPRFLNHFTLPNKSKKIKRIISFDIGML